MSWKTIPYIIIFFLTVPVFSQNSLDKDIEKLSTGFVPEVKKENSYPIDFGNEFRLVFSSAYHFYKSYISSQDANTCAFHPSCSTYAFETLKKNGIFGIFDSFDRLTRCNGFSSENYPKHDHSEHFYDPVKKIR